MPFTSKKQAAKCFALKAKGKAGSWNCDEWAKATPSIKALPTVAEHMAKHYGKSHMIKHK